MIAPPSTFERPEYFSTNGELIAKSAREKTIMSSAMNASVYKKM